MMWCYPGLIYAIYFGKSVPAELLKTFGTQHPGFVKNGNALRQKLVF